MRAPLCALLLVIIASISGLSAAESPDNAPHPRLGMNLAGPADWATELPFVDVFHYSRTWISQRDGAGWGQGPALHLDEHGWVTELQPGCRADALMCTIDGGHYPGGRYTVLYDGRGKLAVAGGKLVDAGPGRAWVDVDPARGPITLQLLRTDPSDYIRNIRVIMPGFENTAGREPFHPAFLRRWQGISCFRFMDWMDTNGSTIKTWADRPKIDDATYTVHGIPLEIMIDLCNRQKADAWFCMPHGADDDYVRHFSAQVKARLDPSLKIYIEYSNEVWNGGMGSNRYAIQRARELALGDPRRPWEGACLFYTRRSLEIFKIWQEVFGGKERLVRVLAWQAASGPYWLDGMLLSHIRPGEADVLAIAPYLTLLVPEHSDQPSGLSADKVSQWTLPQVLDYVANDSLPESRQWMHIAAQAARKYHMKLVAYEAGQHLVGIGGGENNEALTALFHAANADPRMGEIYAKYLNAWQAEGGDLLCNFSSVGQWSKWGSWGLLQYYDDDPRRSPKFLAVMRWARSLGQPVNLR